MDISCLKREDRGKQRGNTSQQRQNSFSNARDGEIDADEIDSGGDRVEREEEEEEE
jgi:hypothetical protein